MRAKLSRRAMLRGAGGAMLGLPFLSAMLEPGRSVAQSSRVPKRFFVFFSGNGTLPNRWRPSGGERDFTLSPILMPLAAHRNDLLILEGIDAKTAIERSGGRNGHDIGMGHMLVARPLREGPSGFGEFGHLWDGSAGGISIDQEVATRLGSGYRFASLEFGVGGDIEQRIPTRMSWRAPFEPTTPMRDVALAYGRIFDAAPTATPRAQERRARRQAVVDAVRGDYERLRARLGPDDRRRVDAHLSAVRDIERRLAMTSATTCEVPAPQSAGTDYERGRLMLDLAVTAMACELTPVASMQWYTAQGRGPVRDLGIDRSHHDLSHDGDSNSETQELLFRINRWYAEHFAHLLTRMKEVQEADGGTLLDHAVVLWVNELGKGNSHEHSDIPYVLAGRAGGAIQTGRFLRFSGDAAHGELFTAILNALGIEAASFGDPDFCRGPLPGIVG